MGQGLIGTNVGVDFGLTLAIVTALVVRMILDVVMPGSPALAGSRGVTTR